MPRLTLPKADTKTEGNAHTVPDACRCYGSRRPSYVQEFPYIGDPILGSLYEVSHSFASISGASILETPIQGRGAIMQISHCRKM